MGIFQYVSNSVRNWRPISHRTLVRPPFLWIMKSTYRTVLASSTTFDVDFSHTQAMQVNSCSIAPTPPNLCGATSGYSFTLFFRMLPPRGYLLPLRGRLALVTTRIWLTEDVRSGWDALIGHKNAAPILWIVFLPLHNSRLLGDWKKIGVSNSAVHLFSW